MISMRKWLGLCEHQWLDTGNMIVTKRQRVSDSKTFVTGYTQVMQCAHCGQIRSFEL